MVQEILVKEQLTREMIEAGARLVDQLAASGMPLSLAMWFFNEESNRWRLLITSPMDDINSKEAHQRIRDAKKTLGPDAEELLFDHVGFISSRNEKVQALRDAFPVDPGSKPLRLTRAGVRGRFIDDALIYRSSPSA